jgi:hypothetical protein
VSAFPYICMNINLNIIRNGEARCSKLSTRVQGCKMSTFNEENEEEALASLFWELVLRISKF